MTNSEAGPCDMDGYSSTRSGIASCASGRSAGAEQGELFDSSAESEQFNTSIAEGAIQVRNRCCGSPLVTLSKDQFLCGA